MILPVTPIRVLTCIRASSYVSFTRRTYFFQEYPAPPNFQPWHLVIHLLKVNKHHVQFLLRFPVFLYHLPRCKYGISCPSARHETELLFSYAFLPNQSVVQVSLLTFHSPGTLCCSNPFIPSSLSSESVGSFFLPTA